MNQELFKNVLLNAYIQSRIQTSDPNVRRVTSRLTNSQNGIRPWDVELLLLYYLRGYFIKSSSVLSRAGTAYAVTRVTTDLAVAVRIPAHTRTCVFITTSEPALKRPSHLVLYFSNKLAEGEADNSSPQITECRAPACPLHLFSFMTQCLSTGTTLSFFCRE